ncbi:protein NLP6-like isoform X2 [Camellia sinensis]|uniref:PB1 domain-containing protein n=1 Tax=Camellia sinensis var. sinensis TaxID=542762 RepID=A0A4S4EQG3_CAMSN|nr:protein NLP6-like isoform X2 [Camellia sinensis]THG18386.1 hypothetical protein TEA_024329 [Camellia sinensis var. sinensis]
MSGTMAENHQQFLWTKYPTDDNMFGDFPAHFKMYVKKNQLLCQRGYFNRGWVFSNQEDDCCEPPPPPPAPFSLEIIDLELDTSVAANRDLVEKIKSVIKWMVFSPGEFLVQFWKAIEIGGRRLLTTRDQPFGVSTIEHAGLCSYRLVSLGYEFCVDVGATDEDELGLLGRVFRHQQPESTPNIGYYSCKEYPQRNQAIVNNISGALTLPVFERSGGQPCVGVLEIVTAAKGNYYLREIKNWMRKDFTTLYKDEAFEAALVEVKEVLELVCRTHYLPLAQIWILCRLCHPIGIGGSFNVSCREHLVSERDTCFHMDKDKFHFSHACSLHTLQKGQGVVGRAFASHNLVFCKDITQFNITEYPLAHYARECSFTGCFAICLQESYTGDNVIVLEFFLPPSYTEGGGDPRFILFLLVATMRHHLKSFKVASGEELGDALSVEVIDFSKDDKLDHFQIPQIARSPDGIENGLEVVCLGLSYQQWLQVDAIDIGNNVFSNTEINIAAATSSWQKCITHQIPQIARSPDRIENGGELASYQQLLQVDAIDTGNNVFNSTEINKIAAATSSQQKCITHPSKRQCRKAGIPISFEDIQKRFGMKLDDAAESLGVSRSTLKRVCREYNISWWSPRKRTKDNGSLSKKIVQGAAEGQIRESSQSPFSDPPHKQDLAIAALTKPYFMEAQDTSTVNIKAKYGEYFIKFQLPVLSGMVEFQQEVTKRLNWMAGTYNVKYQDDDNDWISVSCDEDLRYYICNSRSQGRNPVTFSLQPITSCPP